MPDLSVTFGSYAIPNPNRVDSDFDKIENRLVSIARAAGAFDPSGREAAPRGGGRVQVDFTLYAADQDDMQALIDTIYALEWAGKTTLTLQPQGSAGTRYCNARVESIPIPLDAKDGLVFVPGRIIFQVPSPFWLSSTETTVTVNLSGISTTNTLAYADGGFTAIPTEIKIATGVGQTIQNPIIKRLAASGSTTVWDQLSYVGTLTASQNITINPQKKSILRDGSTGLSAFTWLQKDWFRLDPGNNFLKIEAANVGDAATLTIKYRKTYLK